MGTWASTQKSPHVQPDILRGKLRGDVSKLNLELTPSRANQPVRSVHPSKEHKQFFSTDLLTFWALDSSSFKIDETPFTWLWLSNTYSPMTVWPCLKKQEFAGHYNFRWWRCASRCHLWYRLECITHSLRLQHGLDIRRTIIYSTSHFYAPVTPFYTVPCPPYLAKLHERLKSLKSTAVSHMHYKRVRAN